MSDLSGGGVILLATASMPILRRCSNQRIIRTHTSAHIENATKLPLISPRLKAGITKENIRNTKLTRFTMTASNSDIILFRAVIVLIYLLANFNSVRCFSTFTRRLWILANSAPNFVTCIIDDEKYIKGSKSAGFALSGLARKTLVVSLNILLNSTSIFSHVIWSLDNSSIIDENDSWIAEDGVGKPSLCFPTIELISPTVNISSIISSPSNVLIHDPSRCGIPFNRIEGWNFS